MSSDNRRLLVATVASIAVVIFWQLVVAPKKGALGVKPQAAAEQAKKEPGAAAAPSPSVSAPVAVAPDAPEEKVTLDGKDFTAVVSSHGGVLSSLTLKGEKFVEDKGGKTIPINLVRSATDISRAYAVLATPENGGTGQYATDPAALSPMRVVSKDASSVVLEGRVGTLSIRKTFRLTGKAHEIALEVEVEGGSGKGGAAIVLGGQLPEGTKTGGLTSAPSMDMFRPVCRGGDKTERYDVTGDKEGHKVPGAAAFAGLDMHYFVTAVMPAAVGGECEFVKGPKPKSGLVALTFPVEAGPTKRSFTIYAGPKDLDALRSYGRGLDTAIDYGPVTNLFAVFARGLLYVMRWLESFTHNWGVAIILLTFLVKAVLFPLTYKSTQSMNAMRELQPEVEKLKEKYKNDREKLNLATMQLYQKNKVNPLGGCLPMLMQMPIWFALYAALQTSVELYREPFLWMKDLTVHDPYFVLPAILGISSFAMQKLSPQPADNAQAKMMLYFFPAFFTFIMIWVPGGLTLYIVVNNVLTIVQQRAIKVKTVPAKA
ncbi:MAG TPA: membrane protein insertase YidC [Anaeromyxobacteraceae bacterium]|nr:membrane protein insertase YidC [Anaeromyxobacteraceae bacterium]